MWACCSKSSPSRREQRTSPSPVFERVSGRYLKESRRCIRLWSAEPSRPPVSGREPQVDRQGESGQGSLWGRQLSLTQASPSLTTAFVERRLRSIGSWEVQMARRQFLSLVAGLPLVAALGGGARADSTPSSRRLNIMMKSAWGSDDPTKASFPFLHGHALMKAGHNVQIFLLGEAVGLMRRA